jgi:hypothetical protein
MPPLFFFPSSASASCFTVALCPYQCCYVEKSHKEHALGLEVLEDLVQTTILLHQFVGCFGANTLYWFEIITTKQQTHFDKLQKLSSEIKVKCDVGSRTCDIVISSPSRAFLRSTSRMGCFLASENVR